MKLSLPDVMKAFVDEQVEAGGYSTSGDYVCDLIRKDRDRQRLGDLLLAGATSSPTTAVGDAYFDALRRRLGGTGNAPGT